MLERALLEATPSPGRRPGLSILASVLTHCIVALALLSIRAPVRQLLTRYEPVRLTAPSLPARPAPPRLAGPGRRTTPLPAPPRLRPPSAAPLELPPPIKPAAAETPLVEGPLPVSPLPPEPAAEPAAPQLPETRTGVFREAMVSEAESPAGRQANRLVTGAFSASTPTPERGFRRAVTSTGNFAAARLEVAALIRDSRAESATGVFASAGLPPPAHKNTNRGAPQDSGFGEYRTASPDRHTTPAGAVLNGGAFGAVAASAGAGVPPDSRPVANAGFGQITARQVAAPDAGRRTEPAALAPIEILSKPQPEYTEEGRRLQIEGEVAIEARFGADGKVAVLRILRGLGHGLDECAQRATEAIRFRPARRGGQPIDSVAVVRITFQLAY